MKQEAEDDPRVVTNLAALNRLRHRARGFSFLPRQPITSILSGSHASKLRGRGLNFEELRDYRAGDDIRSVDWKATHRTGSPHVRVFTEERDRPAYLIVDQRQSMFFGSVDRMKSVVAAELASLAAWRILDQGDRVGALVFNETSMANVRPQRSQKAVLRLLHEVVRYNQACSETREPPEEASRGASLNEALQTASRLVKHDGLICVISDFIGADEETRRFMTRLAQHNDVIVCFVHDPVETELPNIGRVTFASEVGEMEVDTARRGLRESFASLYKQRVALAQRILLQRSVPFLPISTDSDPLSQVQHVLGFTPMSKP